MNRIACNTNNSNEAALLLPDHRGEGWRERAGEKKIRYGESKVGSDLEGERRRGEVKENITVAVVSAASRSLAVSCDD